MGSAEAGRTKGSSSSNVPLSSSRPILSRAVSFPRLCCASMRRAPPPSLPCSRLRDSSSRFRSDIRRTTIRLDSASSTWNNQGQSYQIGLDAARIRSLPNPPPKVTPISPFLHANIYAILGPCPDGHAPTPLHKPIGPLSASLKTCPTLSHFRSISVPQLSDYVPRLSPIRPRSNYERSEILQNATDPR